MIRAEELMIGDRVHYKMNLGKDGIYEKDIQIINIYGCEVNCEVREHEIISGKRMDNLEPIPLTPEILEKNGFKSWEHGYIWKERVGMGGQTTSATSPIEIIIYEGGHSVIMNPHEGKDFQGSIDSVHELQHALHLCGINLEIKI